MSGIELRRRPLLASGRTAFRSRRKVWLKTHIWLGLAPGLFLSAIGIAGSTLVFFHEIDERLNPALLIVEALPEELAAQRPDRLLVQARLFAAAARYGLDDRRRDGGSRADLDRRRRRVAVAAQRPMAHRLLDENGPRNRSDRTTTFIGSTGSSLIRRL